MNKSEIKDILHQRGDYLMPETVELLTVEEIIVLKNHTGEEFYIKGHFPGAPIVPGAMLQELCTQSAAILLTKYHSGIKDYKSETTQGHAIGILNKVEFAKFYEPVGHKREIRAKVQLKEKLNNLYKFKAFIYQDDKLKAKFGFNLIHTSDSILYKQ